MSVNHSMGKKIFIIISFCFLLFVPQITEAAAEIRETYKDGSVRIKNAGGVTGKTVWTYEDGKTIKRVVNPGVGIENDIQYDRTGKIIPRNLEEVPKPTLTPFGTRPDNGPTYINDGKKICGPDGCTYTLMAPIGSLLGDSKGQYIINKNDPRGLCSLLNSWFRIGIALAGMLAVVMIVLGGFQYATTDSLFDKEEGKGKIQNALWGLLLALTTWLIVSTINPALANCTINAKEVQLSAMSTTIYNSGALGGGAIGVGMTMADMALQAYENGGADQASIDARYKTITDQWTDADQEALLSDDPATSKAAADKWAGIQKQLDTLNNSFASKGGSFSGGSTNREASWGSPDAGNMNGKTISGRQTYFSPDEAITWDSNTKKGNGAIGKLVEGTGSDGKNALKNDLGTANVVGSAGSVYYPAGTLVEINGIKYVVDDNNLKQNGSGTYVAKNQNVTNNFTVDIFTRNNNYVNTGSDTKRTMTVLYVPTTKVNTAAQINDIRNNPGKYINR